MDDTGVVLIVEDDLDNRQLFREVVEAAGFMPVEASTGQAAIQAAQAYQPRLVLLDLGLGDMSGLDVLRTLRARLGKDVLPVIVVTGSQRVVDLISARELEITDYVRKPVDVKDLAARIRRHVRRA